MSPIDSPSLAHLSTRKSLKGFLIRTLVPFLVLTLATILVCILSFVSETYPISVENWIELAQEFLLLGVMTIFYQMAQRYPKTRSALLLVAGFYTALFIRELDAWFDVINHAAWVGVELIFLLCLMPIVLKTPLAKTIKSLYHFTLARSFPFLMFGTCFVLLFSRTFGSGWFWTHFIADPDIAYHVKRIVEEGLEFLGYCTVLYAAWQYRSEYSKDKDRSEHL